MKNFTTSSLFLLHTILVALVLGKMGKFTGSWLSILEDSTAIKDKFLYKKKISQQHITFQQNCISYIKN
jgi:hypothetical protein